jgi:hypothetical protein
VVADDLGEVSEGADVGGEGYVDFLFKLKRINTIFSEQMREYCRTLIMNCALGGVSYVARTHNVDAEVQDEPVHDDDHRERAPLRRPDGLLKLLDVAEQRRALSALLTPLTPPVSIFAPSANCQTSKGRMMGG